MRRNYQWWREYATNAEGRGAAVEGVAAIAQPDHVHAEQRAAAAAMIAEEANAARLKALLDAAREQANENTILSAEKRFNEAREDWQSTRDALSGQRESQETGDTVRDTPFAVEIANAVTRVLNRISPQQKTIGLGVVVALMLGVGVGTGGYSLLNVERENAARRDVTPSDRITVAPERTQEQAVPAQPESSPSSDMASSDFLPPASDIRTDAIVLPAATSPAKALQEVVIAPKPAAVRQEPKRVYSITLPAAPKKAVTDKTSMSARSVSTDTATRINTRDGGATRPPTMPPAPNPRVAAQDIQVVAPPPPPPPVQIEEAE